MKFVSILLFYVIISYNANAQQFNWLLDLTDTSTYFGCSILDKIIDNQNNIIVLGVFPTQININPQGPNMVLTSDGYRDGYIAKYNPSGSLIWYYQISGQGSIGSPANSVLSNFERKNKLCIDINNNIYCSIRYYDSIKMGKPIVDSRNAPPLSNTIQSDCFIIKLNTNGKFVKIHYFNNSNTTLSDINTSIGNTNSNNIYLTIYGYHGDINFSTVSGNLSQSLSNNNKASMICKLDTNLNLIWQKQIVSNHYVPFINSMVQNTNGDLIIGGRYAVSLDLDPSAAFAWAPNFAITNPIHYNAFVDVLDSNGNYKWGHGFGNTKGAEVSSICNYNNNILVAGSFQDTVDFDPSTNTANVLSTSNNNGFVALYDNVGNYKWVKTFEGYNNTIASISIGTNNDIFLIGNYNNDIDLDPNISKFIIQKPFLTNTTTQPSCFFACKLDSNKNMSWGFQYQSNNGANLINRLSLDAHGSFYISQNIFALAADTIDFDPGLGKALKYNIGASYPPIPGIVTKFTDCNPYKDTLQYAACDSFKMPSGEIITESGWYWYKKYGKNTCDSMILYQLDIGHSSTAFVSKNLCNTNFITASGKIITTSGTYYDTTITQSVNQCDSFITYNIIINYSDASITRVGNKLIANNKNAVSYQWYNCVTHKIIVGATDSIYNITEPGAYALIVTQNGCTDTSACVFPLSNLIFTKPFYYTITPNPTCNGNFTLSFSETYKAVNIEVFNTMGSLLTKQSFNNTNEVKLACNYASGVYIIKLKAGDNAVVNKLVIE
jgi:Secretion system C-terminal sorting domain